MMTALHFWVVCEGFLVDITADQFNDEIEGEEMSEIVFVPLKGKNLRYSKGRTVSLTKNPCSPLNALSIIQGMPKKETKETLKEIGLI
jgi:hypothetical protein